MKKTLKVLAVVMAVVILCATLASCSKTLSGTYSESAGVGSLASAGLTYKFSGSKVTITVTTTLLGSTSSKDFSGKYEIKEADDGTSSITFTFEDSDAKQYSGTQVFEEGKDDNGSFVKIGLAKYYKK